MIFSIGHSTLSAQDFVKRLKAANIEVLWDIRSHPTSRWGQHRKETYEEYLPAEGITYEWHRNLGGWTGVHYEYYAAKMAAVGVDLAVYSKGKFPKQRIAPDRPDAPPDRPAWTNQGLYDYSWFTTLPEFWYDLVQLERLGRDTNVAIMCCEALWWKCHRSMVADVLAFRGVDVQHVPGKKTHVQCLGNRIERYDPSIVAAWPEATLTPLP